MELLCTVNSTDQIGKWWFHRSLSHSKLRGISSLFIGTPPSHPHYRPHPQRLLLERSIFTIYKRNDFSLLTEVRHELPGNM